MSTVPTFRQGGANGQQQTFEIVSTSEGAVFYEFVVRGDDVEAQRAVNDYNRQLQAIGEKEAAGKAIEVEDKRKLEAAQQKVVRHPLLGQMQMAQMDYVDLLRKVDEAMMGEAPQAQAGLQA